VCSDDHLPKTRELREDDGLFLKKNSMHTCTAATAANPLKLTRLFRSLLRSHKQSGPCSANSTWKHKKYTDNGITAIANVERNRSAKVGLLAGRCIISLTVATLGAGIEILRICVMMICPKL
jgi:hypothetical protein